MKKLDDDTSPAGQQLLEAVMDISGAEYTKVKYGYGGEMEEDAKQRLNELAKPLSAEECLAIGAPAGKLVATEQGTDTVQLRDTAKSPNAINAHAHAERLKLAKNARSLTLAADMSESLKPQNSIERTLCHQLAASHEHAMRLLEKSVSWLDNAIPSASNEYVYAHASIEAVRLANASARLMKACQEGALTLAKLRGGGQQQITVVHQQVQIDGGNVAVAGNVTGGDKKT